MGWGEREVKMVNARGNLKVVMVFPSGRTGQEMKKTPQKGFLGIEHKMKQNKNLLESRDTPLEGLTWMPKQVQS